MSQRQLSTNYHFNIHIAAEIGLNAAIFLDNIAYWVFYNQSCNKNLHENLYWTYNRVEDFSKLFPFWSNDQIKRIINYCVENDLLLKGNFNDDKRDRTCWYTLTEKGIDLYSAACKRRNRQMHNDGGSEGVDGLPEPVVVDSAKSPNETGEIAKCYKDTDLKHTTIKQKNKSICPSPDGRVTEYTFFDQFWSLYPRKEGKQDAITIWKTKKLEDNADAIIGNVKERLAKGWARNGKQYILIPKNYLNGAHWNDEVIDHGQQKKKEDIVTQSQRLAGGFQ